MSNSITLRSVFQDRVTVVGVQTVTLDSLRPAYESSYLAQHGLNDTRVKTLVRDMVKANQLWQMQTVAMCEETGEEVLVSGRHRFAALDYIAQHYGINAKGKLVPVTSENEPELEFIDPTVDVFYVELKTKADLVEYLQTSNGSRSMTAIEKNSGKEFGGTLTPLASLKLRAAKRLYAALSESDFRVTTISIDKETGIESESAGTLVTQQTCAAIVSSAFTMIGTKAKYMSDSDINSLVTTLVKTAQKYAAELRGNFSRDGYKNLVDYVLATESQEEVLDKDGDVVEDATVAQYIASTIVAPVKAPAKKSVSALQDQVLELQAKLAELGIGA